MSEHATEIDVAGATAALEERLAAQGDQPRDDQGRFANKPSEEAPTPAAGDGAEEAPEATPSEGTPELTDEEIASFTNIPDEALTPELLAIKRSLQGDYTRKTQEVAPWRKLVKEYDIEDPEDLRARLDAYSQLSDPSNWPTLQQELTRYLEQQGLTPAQAQQAALQQVDSFTQAIPDDEFDVEDDGDDYLPPAVMSRLEKLEQQNTQLVQLMRQQETARQQEAQMLAMAREMTSAENTIRASHKDLPEEQLEEYIDAVYDLAGENGDLHAAAARLDSLLGQQTARYLTSKESALRAPGPVPGEGVIAQPEEEPPHTLEEGHERAMAAWRAMQAQGVA